MTLLWEERFDYKGEECIGRLAEEETDTLKWNTAVVECQTRGVKHVDRRSIARKWGRWWFDREYVGQEKHIEEAISDFKQKIDNSHEEVSGGVENLSVDT